MAAGLLQVHASAGYPREGKTAGRDTAGTGVDASPDEAPEQTALERRGQSGARYSPAAAFAYQPVPGGTRGARRILNTACTDLVARPAPQRRAPRRHARDFRRGQRPWLKA